MFVEMSQMRRPTMQAVVSPQGPNTLSDCHKQDKRVLIESGNL